MELTEKIKQLIKEFEGCRLTAYRCPSGVLTIGYGHTGSDVTAGLTITQAEADVLFDRDIRKFAGQVEPLVGGVKLAQCQYDALVSLAYNIGIGNFRKSTLLAKVRTNPDDPAIRTEFMRHVNARVNGVLKPLAGLVRRREAEANHYFSRP